VTAAVADILAAHRATVRGVLVHLVRDETLADDLVQEALLRATRTAGSFRGDAAPSTWLTAIALNMARDHFRALKRKPPAEPLELAMEIPDPLQTGTGILRAEMSACILEHVARLEERQREAVLLRYFAGLCHKEIAEALGISEGNARVTLHRGSAALRASLGQECILDFSDGFPCEPRPPARPGVKPRCECHSSSEHEL
jgi:RNA polymerase sigma-70 factor (ECF subfamily)